MRTLIRIICIFCIVTCFTTEPAVSSPFLIETSMIKKNFSLRDDTAEVYRYTRKAFSYFTKSPDYELIKAYIDSAEMVCKERNIEIPSLLRLARAEYFYVISDFNSALQEANSAVKLAESSGETKVLVRAYMSLGVYNRRTGFFNESIEYYNKAISVAKKNNLKGYISRSYWGISQVYNILGDNEGYRKNLDLMIEASVTEKDSLLLKEGYLYLGTSYTQEKDRNFDRADSILKQCLEIALITSDTNFVAHSLANLGWNQYLEKNYDISIKYYNRSLTYSVPARLHNYSANSYGNLGTIYRDLNETDLSISNYQKSIKEAIQSNDIYDLSWVHQDMAEMYIRKGDTANAYKSYVLFKKYSDEHITSTNTQGLTDARIRYEADTHNKEIELLSLKFRNQRLLIYGYTGLFILTLAIGLLIFSRAKINAKRKISEMNRKVSEVTQANLRQQMNPHFIFNTLNSIQYYMYQHDKLATNNYLTKFSSLMRKVLENSQHTSVPLRDELDALNLYLDLEKIRFKDKFNYELNVDEEIDTILYKVPTMLMQPFVENSICHGLMPREGNGLIKIDLKLENDYISCIIEDNGIGRKAARERKGNYDTNHNSLGTRIVASRLDLVNALYGTSLKTVYTDLKNEDGEPEGTRVEIHIPLLT